MGLCNFNFFSFLSLSLSLSTTSFLGAEHSIPPPYLWSPKLTAYQFFAHNFANIIIGTDINVRSHAGLPKTRGLLMQSV